MRNLKFASLSLILVGGLAFACNGSDDDGGPDAGGTGGTSSGGGPGSGGTGPGGGTSIPEGCVAVTKATGSPTVVADFNKDEPNKLPENDGRMGELVHASWLSTAGGVDLFDFPLEDGETGMGGTANSFMHFSCAAGNTVDQPQCNTPWDSTKPWQQFVSVDTLLQQWSADGKNCYDVDGVYDAVRFKAKSATGDDKIRIQMSTPDADPDSGETYQSPAIQLTNAWDTYTVPFATIQQPSWSTVTPKSLDLKKLVSISFVVRSVTDQTEGSITGETVNPYDISIDDIEFVKQ